MDMTKSKFFFIAFWSVITSTLGLLAIPVYLLIVCNVVDYATGLMASKYRDQSVNSYKSIRGIFKKISMWLLIVVGLVIDHMMMYVADIAGISVPATFLVACVVTVWLICNEIISILENIQDMGVVIPAFLMPLVKNIKSKMEEEIPTETHSTEDSKNTKEKSFK